MSGLKLSPSIYGADLGDLRGAIRQLEEAKVELLHVDVMDGHFVYNMGFGVDHVRQIKNMTSIPLDVHLMIERPERLVEDFCKTGADMITVHAESTTRLLSCLEKIKACGKKAGIVLCPATSESILKYCLDSTDMVLQMMYNPGEPSIFHDCLLEKLWKSTAALPIRTSGRSRMPVSTSSYPAVSSSRAMLLKTSRSSETNWLSNIFIISDNKKEA